MFGNLIESDSHRKDYARRSTFFLGALAFYAGLFLLLAVGSIYAYNAHFENRDLELVSLIAPVETEQAPTQRTIISRPAAAGGGSPAKAVVVKSPPIIAVMDPTKAPTKVTVAPTAPELPPNTIFRIGVHKDGDNIFAGGIGKNSGTGTGGNDNGGGSNELDALVKQAPPPPEVRKETVKPPEKKIVISKGPINGQATFLPKPVYTQIARTARASGVVTVQVLIDESGKVISASAVSGHPLLLKESVQAALQARFTPTFLGDHAVRVSGVITYNFMLQ